MASHNNATDYTSNLPASTAPAINNYIGPNIEAWDFVPKYSDGLLVVVDKAGNPQKNYPVGAEYSKCNESHPVAMKWKKTWALMAEELNDNQRAKGIPHKLRKFPTSYALYAKTRQGREGQKDYYLYGYPILARNGKPKSFRSAKDFERHFLWLLDDEDAQSANAPGEVKDEVKDEGEDEVMGGGE
ncbi:MAG: hypothetical protein M1812_002426 [Candelaria pacifica]|nr:MAG: hypothetical protein M1812_002426 [Candelaria pacifica]